MTPQDFSAEAIELCRTCQLFGERGWCRATSGNFSVRLEKQHCLITRSGCEKSQLAIEHLMVCDLQGAAVNSTSRPSAETPLHTCLYQLDTEIGAVLHTHSVTSTVLSRASGQSVSISGFEMQKAMSGVSSHEESIDIPIFDNDQDMSALADRVRDAWQNGKLNSSGYLIRGHGLYAWGRDLAEAQRHTEGLEFLMECTWQEIQARTQ